MYCANRDFGLLQEMMTDPVIISDMDNGISYERSSVEEWVTRTRYLDTLRIWIRLLLPVLYFSTLCLKYLQPISRFTPARDP